MITHYTKQNIIQREIMRLKNIFTTNWNQVNKARDCGYEPYNFGASRKEKVGATLIISSLIIPIALPAPIIVPLSYRFLLGGRK